MCIAMHLALIYQAAFALVNEFNRVFDGQNMLRLRLIEVVDQSSKGSALPRACWPRHDY